MQRRRLVIAAACAFACALLLGMPSADAHSTPPTIVTALDPIVPALPHGVVVGLTASIAEELYATNSTETVLAVLATDGEEFLRISKTGVQANVTSPDWWTSNNPGVTPSLPAYAKHGAAPRWVRVTAEPTWAWFDHRLHPVAVTVPAGLLKSNRTAVLSRWSVPMVLDTPFTVSGTVSYQPIRGGFVTTIAAPPQGVTAQILQGRLPGVFLTAPEGTKVFGANGADFARFTATGVEVWTGSLTWLTDRQARGEPLPVGTPHWAHVGDGTTLTWLEPRLAASSDVPERVLASRVPTAVKAWEIPISVYGSPARLSGEVEWVPAALPATAARRSALPFVIAGTLGIVAAGGALVFLRRRRRLGKIPAT